MGKKQILARVIGIQKEKWSVGFCRESRVEGNMSRVEGKMSRVQKCRLHSVSCQKARILRSFLHHCTVFIFVYD